MTRPHSDRFMLVLGLGAGVDADVGLDIPDIALSRGVARDEELGEYRVQIPLEALALEVLTEFLPTADVAELAQVVPDPVVVIVLVLVQPDLGEPDAVPDHHVHVGPPLVRRPLTEDVAHVAAGDDLQGSAAHPGLERQLKVLRSPDVKPVVVGPEPLEEVLVDAKQTPGHGGAPCWRP